jgi:hypothetical protein
MLMTLAAGMEAVCLSPKWNVGGMASADSPAAAQNRSSGLPAVALAKAGQHSHSIHQQRRNFGVHRHL